MKPMTPAELRVAISALGLTQEHFAETLYLGHRTVRNYLGETTPVPPPTAMLIRILVARRNWNDLLTIGYGGKHG